MEIVPLTYNSQVSKANEAKMAEWNRNNPVNSDRSAEPCQDAEVFDYSSEGGIVYATSGEEKEFCLLLLTFDLLDSIACGNCNDLVNGSVQIDLENFCLVYTADAGIDLDVSDTIELIAFESADTITVEFPVVVRRPNNTIDVLAQTVQTETTTNICLPTPTLPGTTFEYYTKDCNDPILGRVGDADDNGCFNYRSFRFGGADQACVVVCDEYCVCDIYNFTINIDNPPSKSLPFFDDFSNVGPFPNPSLWLDDRVWVNNELAFNPPSIGVATFDGIGKDGTPYGGGYGPSDVLTSTYIDLSNNNENEDVNLSFYLSPKGLGYPPTAIDSFKVEFKMNDGSWEEVDGRVAEYVTNPSIPFPGILEKIDFGSIIVIPLDEAEYFHEDFQFRFINNCNRVGVQYVWHLDYVRLSNNVIDSFGSLNDMAFTKSPSLILKNYNHIPFVQFENNPTNEISDNVEIELFNHFSTDNSITDIGSMTISDNISGQVLFQDNNFIDPTVTILDFPANMRFNGIIPEMISSNIIIPNGIDALELVTNYEFDNTEEFSGFGPGIKTNNSVSRTNYITDFYGYDDGSAEVAIKMDQEGAAIASEFDLNVADELRGFEIYFPRFGNGQAPGDEFVVKIFEGSLDSDPIYTSDEIGVLFPDQFIADIAGFTQYRLLDENGDATTLSINPGKMYFAIEQVNNGDLLYIGFDLNSPEFKDKQYFLNTNTLEWVTQNGPGAYMIRPVFGDVTPPSTPIDEISDVIDFEVFPNPAKSEINVKTIDGNFNFTMYDIYGRVILQGDLDGKINVSELMDGLYYLQLNEVGNERSGVQKIQILK